MAKKRRRSAKEWERLVREWKRSGDTAVRFAKKHGVRAKNLGWWAWKLKQLRSVKAGGRTKAAKGAAVQLVPVEIEPNRNHVEGSSSAADVAWELAAPTGHVLRVFGSGATRALDEAVAAITRIDRHR